MTQVPRPIALAPGLPATAPPDELSPPWSMVRRRVDLLFRSAEEAPPSRLHRLILAYRMGREPPP